MLGLITKGLQHFSPNFPFDLDDMLPHRPDLQTERCSYQYSTTTKTHDLEDSGGVCIAPFVATNPGHDRFTVVTQLVTGSSLTSAFVNLIWPLLIASFGPTFW